MPETNCEVIGRIWSDEAAGQPATPEEAAFVTAHLEKCLRCRAEADAIDDFRIDETSLPAEPLDDLSKRRWIDDVLSRADASVGGAQFTRRRSGRIASRRRVSFYWAAAVVAVITGAALMYSQTSERGLSDQQTETAGARVAVEGKLLLSSGEVRSDSAILSFGSALGAGERLAVGQGQAVVDLSTGITLFLDAETEVSIDRLSTKAMEVELSRGRLVAQVDPERVGPRFEITTRSGRILVTGTAFSVTTEKKQVEVEVFRGSVELNEENLHPRRVEVGQAAVLGKAGFVQISEEAGAAAWDVLRTIDMLSRSDAAVVEIRSVPANARVTVDETYLGRTPLSASLRAGHRRLDLSLEDRQSVHEFLDLGRGSRTSRVFDLGQRSSAQTESETSARTAVSPSRTSSRSSAHKPSPEDLLAAAQSYRLARRWNEAVEAYQKLIRKYPASAEARSSLVSLGSIQLENQKRPRAALRSFDSYLKGTRRGTLAQEAAFGRASALRDLKLRDAEAAALRSFLEQFPSAIQASRARERLDEIN